MKSESQLLPFYFGSISEETRLTLERKLLTDPEFLLDYLDLKRSLEAADAIPSQPTSFLWQRLARQVCPPKKYRIPIAIGAALAASVLGFMLMMRTASVEKKQDVATSEQILFDSSSELSSPSGVL